MRKAEFFPGRTDKTILQLITLEAAPGEKAFARRILFAALAILIVGIRYVGIDALFCHFFYIWPTTCNRYQR